MSSNEPPAQLGPRLIWLALVPALLFGSLAAPWPWLPAWLGRFHPLVVHFPIAFLLLAGLLEILSLLGRGRWEDAGKLSLLLGTAGAVAAAASGYLLMQTEQVEGDLMQIHFQTGVTVAMLSVTALILRLSTAWDEYRQVRRIYRGLLAATCLLLVAAGHAGASLTHGEGYLMEHLPWVEQSPVSVTFPDKPVEEWQVYTEVVAPILAVRCYECHSSSNFKGKLALDRWEGLVKGGAHGQLFVAGQPDDSLLIERLSLPLSHKEHMPPRRKPQPDETEIALLHQWIAAGAPREGTLASIGADAAWIDLARALPAALHGGEAAPEPEPELDAAAVAALRADVAPAVDVLQQRFPGMIVYESRQSANVDVNASLFGRQFGDEELAALNGLNAHIVRLDLSGTAVTDRGLAALASMPNLRVLRLNETRITDAGVSHLRDVPSLQSVSLFRTQVTNASLEHLASHPQLRQWTVAETRVTADALAAAKAR